MELADEGEGTIGGCDSYPQVNGVLSSEPKNSAREVWDQGDPVPALLPVLLSPTEPTSGGRVKENAYILGNNPK